MNVGRFIRAVRRPHGEDIEVNLDLLGAPKVITIPWDMPNLINSDDAMGAKICDLKKGELYEWWLIPTEQWDGLANGSDLSITPGIPDNFFENSGPVLALFAANVMEAGNFFSFPTEGGATVLAELSWLRGSEVTKKFFMTAIDCGLYIRIGAIGGPPTKGEMKFYLRKIKT